MCVHDYFEGFLRPELFSEILGAWHRNGIRTCTLHEAAREIDRSGLPLPASRLTRGTLTGFVGDVSWQSQSPAPGSTDVVRG